MIALRTDDDGKITGVNARGEWIVSGRFDGVCGERRHRRALIGRSRALCVAAGGGGRFAYRWPFVPVDRWTGTEAAIGRRAVCPLQ